MSPATDGGFDTAAAVTRSLLGWGVVAGIFYLVVGVTQGLLRDGFSFAEHPLSLLMLGDFGWVQATNLIVTGLMVMAAAVGFRRAMQPDRRATRAGVLLGVVALGLVGSGIFPPDAVDGFPFPDSTATATAGGVAHLALGGIGFLALAAVAFVMTGWFDERGESATARRSRLAGIVVLVGFLGGAALAAQSAGVIALWLAVVTGWVWLAATSLRLYRTVPHPDRHLREPAGPGQ